MEVPDDATIAAIPFLQFPSIAGEVLLRHWLPPLYCLRAVRLPLVVRQLRMNGSCALPWMKPGKLILRSVP
jgi:hypothetical protein